MSDQNQPVKWTEEQWARIRQAVHEEATRTRVAASFLPLYGPLSPDTVTMSVPKLTSPEMTMFGPEPRRRLEVNDYETLPIISIAVEVYVKGAQMADPDLSTALLMFRRAANIVSRVEDAIVFNGKTRVVDPKVLRRSLVDSQQAAASIKGRLKDPAEQARAEEVLKGIVAALTAVESLDAVKVPEPRFDVQPKVYDVNPKDYSYPGLKDVEDDMVIQYPTSIVEKGAKGEGLVSVIVEAIEKLERNGHLGPFACVLDDRLFTAVNTPSPASMVLPSDRITPFLNGPLLRTSVLEPGIGVVVSLAGAPVELVVAQDISVCFLQVNPEPRWVFRVSERILLRIKEQNAVVRLEPDGPLPDRASVQAAPAAAKTPQASPSRARRTKPARPRRTKASPAK